MNPAKYFNITNLGQVFVKPLGAAKTLPYEVWLETVLKYNFYNRTFQSAVSYQEDSQEDQCCWSCGSPNQNQGKFCGKCGERLG